MLQYSYSSHIFFSRNDVIYQYYDLVEKHIKSYLKIFLYIYFTFTVQNLIMVHLYGYEISLKAISVKLTTFSIHNLYYFLTTNQIFKLCIS